MRKMCSSSESEVAPSDLRVHLDLLAQRAGPLHRRRELGRAARWLVVRAQQAPAAELAPGGHRRVVAEEVAARLGPAGQVAAVQLPHARVGVGVEEEAGDGLL